MTEKRPLKWGSIALYSIGSIILLFSGALSIGQAATDPSEASFGVMFMVMGALGIFQVFRYATRQD